MKERPVGVDAIVTALATGGGRPSERSMLARAGRLGIAGLVARRTEIPEAPGVAVARRFRDRLLRDAAAEIGAELSRCGLVHFFCRGAALARLYALGDRDMADIDVYVGPEAVEEAQARLQGLGFHPAPRADQSGPVGMRCTLAMVRGAGRVSVLDEAHVDLHWGIEPVDRLLPRSDVPVPARVWSRLQCADGIWAPAPAHHAALLVHHLVHHDFLHVRGLVDLVRLWEEEWLHDGAEFVRLAGELGVRRVALVLHEGLVRDLGLTPIAGVNVPPSDWRTRRLAELTALAGWLRLALEAPPREYVAVTRRRVGRRIMALDRLGAARHVVLDAVFPPRAHLEWRWPDAPSAWHAWWRHATRAVTGSLRAESL